MFEVLYKVETPQQSSEICQLAETTPEKHTQMSLVCVCQMQLQLSRYYIMKSLLVISPRIELWPKIQIWITTTDYSIYLWVHQKSHGTFHRNVLSDVGSRQTCIKYVCLPTVCEYEYVNIPFDLVSIAQRSLPVAQMLEGNQEPQTEYQIQTPTVGPSELCSLLLCVCV